MELKINDKNYQVEADGDTPLLWVIRDELGLTGTKYGCGIAQCGACSVLIDGVVARSCVIPIAGVSGRKISTIEAIEQDATRRRLLGQAPSGTVWLLPVWQSDCSTAIVGQCADSQGRMSGKGIAQGSFRRFDRQALTYEHKRRQRLEGMTDTRQLPQYVLPTQRQAISGQCTPRSAR